MKWGNSCCVLACTGLAEACLTYSAVWSSEIFTYIPLGKLQCLSQTLTLEIYSLCSRTGDSSSWCKGSLTSLTFPVFSGPLKYFRLRKSVPTAQAEEQVKIIQHGIQWELEYKMKKDNHFPFGHCDKAQETWSSAITCKFLEQTDTHCLSLLLSGSECRYTLHHMFICRINHLDNITTRSSWVLSPAKTPLF